MADLDFLGPEDTGSMAAKLARMEAGVQPDPEVQPEPEPEPEPKKEEEAPPEETPAAEAKPPETEPPPEEEIPEGWEFKPKYQTHQEAEKGAREHQQKVTAATEETKREREAREAAERERDELKNKLAEKEAAAAKPPEPPAKTAEELEAEEEARIVAALQEIGGLDESDPDFTKKSAKAWRKAGMGGTGQPAVPDTKALEEIIGRRVTEILQSRDAEAVQQREQDATALTREKAVDLAAKAGLDMTTDSADEILFWSLAGRLPDEMKGKPLQEQVDWAAGEVRKRIGKVVQMTDAEREKARKAQTDNAVLERGNTRPVVPAAAPKLRSMEQILEDLDTKGRQQRRA
jgi:hypothetical protein